MSVGSAGVGIDMMAPSMGVTTDAALMVRVKRGDQDAFGDLIDRHKDGLVNYLTKLTRDRDRAEELSRRRSSVCSRSRRTTGNRDS